MSDVPTRLLPVAHELGAGAVAAALDRASEQVAARLVDGRLSPDQLRALQRLAASDRLAFVDGWSAWSFVLSLLPAIRLALEAIERAREDNIRLRQLAADERRSFARMVRAAAGLDGLQDDIRQVPVPRALRRGRKNETDLRDLVIEHVRRSYPANGRAGSAWKLAVAVVAMVWRYVPNVEDLKRDSRRRIKRLEHAQSRACAYYFSAIDAGALARVLRDAAGNGAAVPRRMR